MVPRTRPVTQRPKAGEDRHVTAQDTSHPLAGDDRRAGDAELDETGEDLIHPLFFIDDGDQQLHCEWVRGESRNRTRSGDECQAR